MLQSASFPEIAIPLLRYTPSRFRKDVPAVQPNESFHSREKAFLERH